MRIRSHFVPAQIGIGTLAIVTYLGVQSALHAQVAPPAPKAATPPGPAPVPVPAKNSRIAEITADRYDDKKTPAGTIFSLLGHAKIVSDKTTVLTTDTAFYNQKTSVANAPGRIEINDPQNTIIGDSGTAYYTKRDAKINGNVHMTMRPKPEEKDAPEGSARREFKNPVFITCEHVDYDWKSRIAVATGNLVMKTEDRTVTAEKATYYGNQETVVLTGKVHYSRPNNDYGDTEEYVAIVTEGKERFYSPGSGHVSITVDNEEDSGAPSGASPIPPPPGSPTGTPAKPSAAPATPLSPSSTPSTPPVQSPPVTPPAAAPPVTTPPITPSAGVSSSTGTPGSANP